MKSHSVILALPMLLLALAAGCYTGGATAGPGDEIGGSTGGPGEQGAGGSPVDTFGEGLPCDVAQLMKTRCVSCHNSPPVGSAPMPLVSRADLLAPAKSDPSKTVAQRSLERMQAGTMPPMPATQATADEVAVLQGWIAAGTPAGACGADGGAVLATPDPLNAQIACSSGTYWDGESAGYQMAPGQPCIGCHASSRDDGLPRFAIAGTVYTSGHEHDGCNGVNGTSGPFQGAAIVLTDRNGHPLASLPVNGVGNFTTFSAPPAPFYAKLTFQGRERVMTQAVPNGDCNRCHTSTGANGAPGRITLPQ
ncbi:MAG: hypothetical protein HY898_20915 [Deltaproteobacteria bacterium]|nr:hypothetical protein [Deltaproteobacteria bacterium]